MRPQRGLPLFIHHGAHLDPTPFHEHDFYELAVVMRGDALHHGIHGQRAVGRGDCLALRPGQWHGYSGCTTLDLFNLCIPVALFAHELAWLVEDAQVSALLGPLHSAGAAAQEVLHLHLDDAALDGVRAAFQRLEELMRAPDALRSRAELLALAATVLARTAAALPRRLTGAAQDLPLAALAATMAGDLARPWKLSELARRAGMTRAMLCRHFRHLHGAPPLTWLTTRRCERAAVLLLSTDQPVAAIAKEVGWEDANYCARRFRAAFGVSPVEYRRRALPRVRSDVTPFPRQQPAASTVQL
jgi:AraC family L-rhamnose operon transcriptional activator RhaR